MVISAATSDPGRFCGDQEAEPVWMLVRRDAPQLIGVDVDDRVEGRPRVDLLGRSRLNGVEERRLLEPLTPSSPRPHAG